MFSAPFERGVKSFFRIFCRSVNPRIFDFFLAGCSPFPAFLHLGLPCFARVFPERALSFRIGHVCSRSCAPLVTSARTPFDALSFPGRRFSLARPSFLLRT